MKAPDNAGPFAKQRTSIEKQSQQTSERTSEKERERERERESGPCYIVKNKREKREKE